jgi:hypothetical protein
MTSARPCRRDFHSWAETRDTNLVAEYRSPPLDGTRGSIDGERRSGIRESGSLLVWNGRRREGGRYLGREQRCASSRIRI